MSLKLVNVSKRHKEKWILRDISLEIARGEILGLFGPSGSGKTRLLDIIAGNSQPNGGSIFFDGTDITKSSRDDRHFSAPGLVDGSIWKRLWKEGKSASKGERITRDLNGAIERAANVFILDDPFCGMDANSREDSVAKLRTATHDKNLAVIIATSNFEEVLEVCDEAAVIVNGEIRHIGVPQEIYEKPASRIVAGLTGRNNLFPARRLTSSKAEIPEFHTIDGAHRLFAQRIERGALGALNQNVTLAIRPEHISISFGASFPEDNLLKAKVTSVKFLGPTTLIHLDADGLALQALVLRLVGLNPGDECMVGLPPDRILIYRD